MPQYKLTFRSRDGDHVYVRVAKDISDAKSFVPLVSVDPDTFIELDGELIEVEEQEVSTVFQLGAESYAEVQEIAASQGLHSEKSVGAYCLEVRGCGDWMLSDWVRKYKRLTTSWMGRL